MNKSVLVPAFKEPSERDECYTNDHVITCIITNMENIVKGKHRML